MAGAGTEQVTKGKLGHLVSPIGIDNVDWLALREEWITTGISLKELAEKYRINYFTLRSYYYRHQWAYHLSHYREQVYEVTKKIREVKSEELAMRLMKVDERVVGLCETILDGLEEAVDDTLVYKKSHTGEANKVDIKDAIVSLKNAMETMQKLHQSVRLAGGGPTARLDINTLPDLDPEERKRIEDEYGYLRAQPKASISISHTVVSDQPPQDTQGPEDNVQG